MGALSRDSGQSHLLHGSFKQKSEQRGRPSLGAGTQGWSWGRRPRVRGLPWSEGRSPSAVPAGGMREVEKSPNREVGLPWGLDCPRQVHTCYLRACLSPWGHGLPQGKDHSWLHRRALS